MSQSDTSPSFLDVESPESPEAVGGADAPISPGAPAVPTEGFTPYSVELTPPGSDSNFFAERIEEIRRKRAEELSRRIQAESDQLFGQDGISVTDIKKFQEAMNDLEDLNSIATATSQQLDFAFDTYLKYKYDISTVQARALNDYFSSGQYKSGDIPTVLEGARPSSTFVGPMRPEYYGRTPILDPSTGQYIVEGVRPGADFIGPMPPEMMSVEEFEVAAKAADQAAAIGSTKEQIQSKIDEELAKAKPGIELAKKLGLTAAAFLSLDAFYDNPNAPNALLATGATSAAVSAWTSLAEGVAGPPTQTAAISTSIANFVNPINYFIAATQLARFVIGLDEDYRRQSANLTYSNGTLNISNVGYHDGAKNVNWADSQSKTAKKMFESLIKDYGFVVDEAAMARTLKRKGYMVNNVVYGQRMGGRDGSMGAADLMYSLMREGALKVSNNTPEEILKDPSAFIKFIGDFQRKTQDEYAKYIWANYGGKEDYRSVRNNKGIVTNQAVIGYAAFGSQDLARAQVSMLNNAHRVRMTGPGNRLAFVKEEWSVKKTEARHVGGGQIVAGGFTPTSTVREYQISYQHSERKPGRRHRTAIEYTRKEALAMVKSLNSSSKVYSKKFKKGRAGSETGKAKDFYAVAKVGNKYYIGTRTERLS